MGKEEIKFKDEFVTKSEYARKLWKKRIMENTILSNTTAEWMTLRICSLLDYMQYGYALIAYRKQDDSFYLGRGTLLFYEREFRHIHNIADIKAHVVYWDVEQQGWRTFQVENFLEWRPIVS